MNYRKINLHDKGAIREVSYLASHIVKEHYDPILGSVQNDYMIRKFQSVPAITEQLEHGYQYYLVENLEGQQVGFLACYPRESEWYLSKFYIEKGQRGKGISKNMLQFVIDQAKENGFSSIVLNVNKRNNALHVYEKLGFQRIREEKNDIGNGFYMDDYVYQYKI